jgi:anti-anti-sigma factor
LINASFQIETSVVTITLEKDLTVFYNDELSDKVKLFESQSMDGFIFDLSHTTWIDSMGIQCVLAAGKICHKTGHKVQIVGANEKVHYTISLIKLDIFIEFAVDMNAARAHFGV